MQITATQKKHRSSNNLNYVNSSTLKFGYQAHIWWKRAIKTDASRSVQIRPTWSSVPTKKKSDNTAQHNSIASGCLTL